MIVSDEDVEAALDYLRDNARAAAKAVAYRIYMTEYRKSKKAELMGQCNEAAVNAQERFAYSHPEYRQHLDDMQTAVEDACFHEFMLKAANAKIEVWKTDQYRIRAMEKIT
jgi:hypothetical protein